MHFSNKMHFLRKQARHKLHPL